MQVSADEKNYVNHFSKMVFYFLLALLPCTMGQNWWSYPQAYLKCE